MATLASVITQARYFLQDTREPLRHSDDKLYTYLNLALAEARRLRPDLFYPNVVDTEYTYTAGDSATTFPLDFAYQMAVSEFISGAVSLEEDEFVVEGRAVAMLTRFTNKLVGKGV